MTIITRETGKAAQRGIGQPVSRPDADLKLQGGFAFSSDLSAEGMLWGHTVRSPYPYARIEAVNTSRAEQVSGVHAVLTAQDIPGQNSFGLIVQDQPVLAVDVVRYQGEPVAIVAAETPEIARFAASLVDVVYTELTPICETSAANSDDAPKLHPGGNIVRHIHIRRGKASLKHADVVVAGEYTLGMQDQAPLGTESGLARPTDDGGVELCANSQWIHADRNQLAAVLGLPPSKIHINLGGVGGAFGGREDMTLHAHLCLLALRTGLPVKMVYSREESFFGHVHRHPATLRYEHGARRDGKLLYVKCAIEMDGGAYASTSAAVISNTTAFAVGPYVCPNVDLEGSVFYTNNPPCGAMRGFGAVQAAFACEAQMDRLAQELGLDPIEFRLLNVLEEGDTLPTGQAIDGAVPARKLLEELKRVPLPDGQVNTSSILDLPGGAGNVTHGEGIRRGVGIAIGFKAGGMPEGIRDYSTARVKIFVINGRVIAEVRTAAAEVGQGLTTVQMQIVQSELGIDDVVVVPADTTVGSAGSSSASRQTYMTGGAVLAACVALKSRVIDLAHEQLGHHFPDLLEFSHLVAFRDSGLWGHSGTKIASLADVLGERVVEEERRFDHWTTTPYGEDGQGEPHVQFIFAAHRAVADVDIETGLTHMVELVVAQDVGRAINPLGVEGQLQGGTAQGLGLALMEEIQTKNGRILNPSFTDYLIPTILDIPSMKLKILEIPDPRAPYGVKGAGEPSTISSTPAIVAALRDATGHQLTRVPIKPWHLLSSPSRT